MNPKYFKDKSIYNLELIEKMEAMFRYSNTFYSGESEGLNWVF